MISVQEAERFIFDSISQLAPIEISIHELTTQTLYESHYADRPYPPFHRVTMDGIAIQTGSLNRQWQIQGLQKAGDLPQTLQNREHAIEIMTGSVLPHASNAVIRYEDLVLKEHVAHLKEKLPLQAHMNIHLQGSDCEEGALLIEAGTRCSAAQLGVLASIGKEKVLAIRLPKVAVISTGDELVAIGESPKPQQIRRSNSYALKYALSSYGIREISLYETKDSLDEMRRVIDEALSTHDLILISGGVSAGKFDWAPQALADLAIHKIFHKVRQKPGKPLWFGMNSDNKIVFGLPGNPQSTLVCFYRYITLALSKLMGRNKIGSKIYAKLKPAKAPNLVANLVNFVPVCVSFDEQACIYAEPVLHQGSGDFVNLAKSDGFIELAENEEFVHHKAYPLYLWQNL